MHSGSEHFVSNEIANRNRRHGCEMHGEAGGKSISVKRQASSVKRQARRYGYLSRATSRIGTSFISSAGPGDLHGKEQWGSEAILGTDINDCNVDNIHTRHISVPIETSDTGNENVGSTNMNSLKFALKIAHTHGDTRYCRVHSRVPSRHG